MYRSWTYFLCSSDQLHHKVAAHSVKACVVLTPQNTSPYQRWFFYHEAGKFWKENSVFWWARQKSCFLNSGFINGCCFLSKFQQSTQHLGERKKTYTILTMSCWTEMPMPWTKAPEKWKERQTSQKQFRAPKKKLTNSLAKRLMAWISLATEARLTFNGVAEMKAPLPYGKRRRKITNFAPKWFVKNELMHLLNHESSMVVLVQIPNNKNQNPGFFLKIWLVSCSWHTFFQCFS